MDPNHHSDNDLRSSEQRRQIARPRVEPLPPGVFPGRQPLAGHRVRLEPLDPRRHSEKLFAIGHHDDDARALWDYLPYGPFADANEMHTWVRECAGKTDPVFLAIRRCAGEQLLGMASFLEIRPPAGVIEIGHIWFAPPFQGSADVTEALYIMMCHAMDDLGNRRLEWKCNALNAGSRSAALRLGFRFEGVFYNHLITKGRSRDTAWYSLLDTEWPAVKGNFQRWLATANFRPDGQQILSLGTLNQALW